MQKTGKADQPTKKKLLLRKESIKRLDHADLSCVPVLCTGAELLPHSPKPPSAAD